MPEMFPRELVLSINQHTTEWEKLMVAVMNHLAVIY